MTARTATPGNTKDAAAVVREGGCLCGAIRYRVTGEPLTVYVCHCTDCQRHGGSAFAISMVVRKTDFALVQGEPRTYSVQLENTHRRGRFCGECATRLWGEPVRYPQIVVVRPGTLDDTSWLQPIGHIWTRSAQPWLAIAKGPYDCEGQPADSMTMIHAWRKAAPAASGAARTTGPVSTRAEET